MNITLKPGKYVVAVSGGVDSMALLHMLVGLANSSESRYRFVVAHFDHGIREDSKNDRQNVEQVAREYGLPFVHHQGKLGPNASEARARQARYSFLHSVREAAGAQAVITAHHQDDLVETAILNLLRGTGRRGLSALHSNGKILRPLLHMTKNELYQYADTHQLVWGEDETNKDVRYLRNYIRHNIIPKLGPEKRQQLLEIIKRTHELNQDIEALLVNHLHVRLANEQLERHWFVQLPHNVSREVLASWLRRHKIRNLSSKLLERLVVAAKTFSPGQQADIDAGHRLKVMPGALTIVHPNR